MSAEPASAARAPAHPAFELLGRYRAVLGAAWTSRRELTGPRHLADEAAFLPAALSLQATPVHPAPRRAMWVIVALFVGTLAWSFFGQVDIVAVAPGRIVVSDRTKVVQPLEPAVVRAIHVRDGDHVRAGQLLIELDPTNATADRTGVQEQRRSALSDALRSEALLRAMSTGAPPKLPAEPESTQSLLSAEWADIRARTAKLDAEIARKQAEAATAKEQLAKVAALLPLARHREGDFKALAEQGFVAGHAGQDRTRDRLELERDHATYAARAAEVEAGLKESRQAGTALRAELQRSLTDRAAQARLKVAQLEQEDQKVQRREQLTRLVAPIEGTVQQLAIHTTGGVVTAAQPLLVVVPTGADVTAEVVIENKDIGFVRAGQRVAVKLETFSFTRYGTVSAEVVSVSADAVSDEKRGAIFPATLRFERSDIDVDGKPIRLAQGMNLTAEITTGRRRVIEFLTSSISAATASSLKER